MKQSALANSCLPSTFFLALTLCVACGDDTTSDSGPSPSDAGPGVDAPRTDARGVDAGPRPDVPGVDAPSEDVGGDVHVADGGPDVPVLPDAGPDRPVTEYCPAPMFDRADPSLARTSGVRHLMGGAVKAELLREDADYARVVRDEFDFITAEYQMKWGSLEPTLGSPNYTDSDYIVEQACLNDQEIRGHALLWYFDLPDGLEALASGPMQTEMDRHIMDTVTRYRGAVRHWDVVNEAIDDESGFRDDLFFRTFGVGYIERAFRTARAADPNALLGYNDYDIAGTGGKSDRAYELVRSLVTAGAPIDYVGFQGHVQATEVLGPDGMFTEERVYENIERYAALGLRVYLTEVDVRTEGVQSDEDHAQREAYRRMVSACVRHEACHGVTVWGVSDQYSWIRAWDSSARPLPFNETFGKKAAYFGIEDGFLGGAGVFGPSLCGGTPSLYCDGFEYSSGWTRIVNGGMVNWRLDAANNGLIGLDAQVEGGSQAALTRALPRAYTSGSLSMRAHVRILPSTTASTVTLFSAFQPSGAFPGVSVSSVDGNLFAYSTVASQGGSGPALSRDEWHCVEVRFDIAESGRAEVFLDGASAIIIDGVDTRPDAGFGSMSVGIVDTNGPSRVHIDDFVVSEGPIGCE